MKSHFKVRFLIFVTCLLSHHEFLSARQLQTTRDRIINIVALQAGTKHSEKRNPGLEKNFEVFEKLSIQASKAQTTPDLICFPEYAVSGWEYPSEQVINGIAEQIPGKGYWYIRYRGLAIKTGIPLVGWLVESDMGMPKTTLGIEKSMFVINKKPTFLYGISYYGGLGASESSIQKDLADIKKNGFNWIRIWANWPGTTTDISAVNDEGNPVLCYMKKLRWIVRECNMAGIVVDVTLAHGNNTNGRSLKTIESHDRAVRSVVSALKSFRNWYLDLANERDIGDSRFVSFDDLSRLRETAKQIYPDLLITASAGNDISQKDLESYLNIVKLDFITPHRPRTPGSAHQTEGKTLEYLLWMKNLGRIVPVHYQEPFRRGYSNWQPVAKDYLTDFLGAKKAGAAGWCFHNGDQRASADLKPGRSFDLQSKRLFDQLDPEELRAISALSMQLRN